MVLTRARRLSCLAVLWLGGAGLWAAVQSARAPDEVRSIVDRSCNVAGCHDSRAAAAGLDLSADRFPASVIDAPSREVPGRRIVDTAAPSESYLLAKVKGTEGIVGARMPVGRPPLEPEEVRALEDWAASLAAGPTAARAGDPGAAMFQGTRLVNLPTTNVPARGEALFLVAHRFLPAVSTGSDTFYGLDGPASVHLSLGYGVTDRVAVAVGRGNLDQELEVAADWLLLPPRPGALPLAVKLRAGGAWVTGGRPDLSGGDRVAPFAQLCLAWRLSDRLSLEAVPGFAARTNEPAASGRAVWALGLGGRWLLGRRYAVIGDWVPVLSGEVNPFSTWGAGVEARLGGHVFQVFATNAVGISVPRYLAGGDLRLGDGDFRLGFHIFRSF